MGKKQAPKQTDAEFGGPNKPLSGYFLFGGSIRPGIMADMKAKLGEGERMNLAAIGTTIGAKWKEAAEDVKKKWNDEAAANKKVYEEKMAEWEKTDNAKAFKKAKANFAKAGKDKKAMEDLHAAGYPKRPQSSWFMFTLSPEIQEKAKEIALKETGKATVSIGDTTPVKKKLWDALSAEERAAWDEKAKKAKAEYETKKAEFEVDTNEAWVAYQKAKKKSEGEKDKMLGKKKSAMKRKSTGASPASAGKRRKLDDSAEPNAEESPIEASASSSSPADAEEDAEEMEGEEAEEVEGAHEEEAAGQEESPADEA